MAHQSNGGDGTGHFLKDTKNKKLNPTAYNSQKVIPQGL